ncbi:MAG: hypothetical protein HYW26_01625 [Candidatus Aenigmarchaeota archaeon]|nr:hypothetical protein [Candidatus Aenigmarchaeota archaeon]
MVRLEQREKLIGDEWQLDATLRAEETAKVLDVLRGIEEIELHYSRYYVFPVERMKVFEPYLRRALSDILGIRTELIAGHSVKVDAGEFVNLNDPARPENRYPIVRLNFDGMTGLDIVQFGFSKMRGYDKASEYPLVKIVNRGSAEWVWPGNHRWQLSDQYDLTVLNPTQDATTNYSPEVKYRTLPQAQHVAKQLVPVLPIKYSSKFR